MQNSQGIINGLRKGYPLLNGGETILIGSSSFAMCIQLKVGHQLLPKIRYHSFIGKCSCSIKLPGPEVQGFALPGTVGLRPSRFHTRCLGGTTCMFPYQTVSGIFNNIPFFAGSVDVVILSVKYHPVPFHSPLKD